MGLLKGAAAFLNHCFYCNVPTFESLSNPRMRALQSRSLIFLSLPLLRVTFSTIERWSLVVLHIRATDDFEISCFRAISWSDSPVFSVRNQTLAGLFGGNFSGIHHYEL